MKLGDIIYDSDMLPETRGELQEFLAEIVLMLADAPPSGSEERLSNGEVADALFAALDLFEPTPENKAKVQQVFNEWANLPTMDEQTATP